MATPIKPKRSYTATNVPSGLSAGELAVNAADGKVWIGSSDGKSNVLISSLSLSDMAGTTSNITEGSNLYYTDSRARLSLSAGTGISYDNKTGAITNSSPDQTVVLTAGTGISTSGTYPNFTITNSSPDQTVKLTSGTGISITGTYPDFTITNSSPSGGGTVTSVGLTAPTGMKVTGSPVTGSGTLALAMDTGYALPTTASQTNWDSAYSERRQWDGGSTNLVAATARTSLGLVIGTNVQAWDADLDAIAALAGTSGLLKKTAANTWSLDTTAYGSGTVTSIATTSPITGGTITGSGTIGINASSANTASYVVQRDASGNFAAGTITASLTGTASTATNLAAGSGGTIPYQSAAGTTAMLSAGTSGQYLKSNGTSAPSWSALPSYLPVYTRAGSTTNVSVANGSFTVTLRGGSTVNVTVS